MHHRDRVGPLDMDKDHLLMGRDRRLDMEVLILIRISTVMGPEGFDGFVLFSGVQNFYGKK
jgi:hypothetical protein